MFYFTRFLDMNKILHVRVDDPPPNFFQKKICEFRQVNFQSFKERLLKRGHFTVPHNNLIVICL